MFHFNSYGCDEKALLGAQTPLLEITLIRVEPKIVLLTQAA